MLDLGLLASGTSWASVVAILGFTDSHMTIEPTVVLTVKCHVKAHHQIAWLDMISGMEVFVSLFRVADETGGVRWCQVAAADESGCHKSQSRHS